jgi:hypothetical protein
MDDVTATTRRVLRLIQGTGSYPQGGRQIFDTPRSLRLIALVLFVMSWFTVRTYYALADANTLMNRLLHELKFTQAKVDRHDRTLRRLAPVPKEEPIDVAGGE